MSRTYKTSSGVYKESELAVAIWINPKHVDSPQSRYLETMTSDKSRDPMAFPISDLKKHPAWENCPVATCPEDLESWIFSGSEHQKATRQRPILIPLDIATQYMGWDRFYVPSEYSSNHYDRF
jgi:hypothetical protein